ncbi:MAG: HAD-IIIA family hydrolase [Chitinophagaceae bacterium]
MSQEKQKAIFLDKDGTLIPDIPYNVNPALITLEQDCIDGLKSLQEDGFKLVIITNQAGVALGYFEESTLQVVKERVHDLLACKGITLDAFYYCPHHPNGVVEKYTSNCECRKPKAGLLILAAGLLNLDLSKSWMIGDILNDVEAGNTAGTRTILINNGNETEWLRKPERQPHYLAGSINEAAEMILRHH